jgi:hypothetical protein
MNSPCDKVAGSLVLINDEERHSGDRSYDFAPVADPRKGLAERRNATHLSSEPG